MELIKKYGVSLIVALLILGATFFSGFFIGERQASEIVKPTTLYNTETNKPEEVDFSSFWKVWNYLDDKYVSTTASSSKNVTDQDRVWGAIQGLVASLGDPHTIFFPPTEAKMFQEEISGNFTGIGVEIDSKNGV